MPSRRTPRLTLAKALQKLAECDAVKDGVYDERSRVLALATRLAQAQGFSVGIGQDPLETDPNWKNVIFLDLPSGQVSWHIAKRDLRYFPFLGSYSKSWNGHTTPEKYRRIFRFTRE